VGTVVMARQKPLMSTGYYDAQRKKMLNVLASFKDARLEAQKKDTKPTKKTKSPKEYLP
jgi:hypothetical protein